MKSKVIEALHFYGIKDEKYKKRCLEVVYDINNNEVLKNKVEELFYKLVIWRMWLVYNISYDFIRLWYTQEKYE